MKPTRRTILKTLAASAAAAFAARRGLASGSNTLSTWTPSLGWGAYGQPRKVLEIFLRGGASFWGSFWYDTALGAETADTTFSDWASIKDGAAPSVHGWTGVSGPALGAAAAPLSRATAGRRLTQKMRVLRVRHDLLPHELAIPYAATGTTFGRPKMAGLGAALWRRYEEQNPGAPVGPKSLIFQTKNALGDIRAATYLATTGNHGARYRPPVIRMGDSAFYDGLDRSLRAGSDELKRFYGQRYKKRLIPSGGSDEVRSLGFEAYNAAGDSLINDYAVLREMLGLEDELLFPPEDDPLWGALAYADSGGLYTSADLYARYNPTRYAIRAALDLLTNPAVTVPVQHIAVIDGGVESDYDTHDDTASGKFHNGNIWNVCDVLAGHLEDIFDNGVAVLIHTEFGRIYTAGDPGGSDHHTRGYVNVVLSDLVSKGYEGLVDGPSGEEASHVDATPDHPGLTPTDVHAAVAQLAGIKPWQEDMFDADLALTGGAPLKSAALLGL
jgi:hypothetical protein